MSSRIHAKFPRHFWRICQLHLCGGIMFQGSCAESFARGAVGLLAATGVVDVLSFGSETGELAPLRAAAGKLQEEPVG